MRVSLSVPVVLAVSGLAAAGGLFLKSVDSVRVGHCGVGLLCSRLICVGLICVGLVGVGREDGAGVVATLDREWFGAAVHDGECDTGHYDE